MAGALVAGCGSDKSYDHLTTGGHSFCVKAFDKAGNASSATCYAWTIGAAGLAFTIAGTPLANVLLYPGGPDVPVNLVFTNPNNSAITITSATVSISGTSTASCPVSGHFTVAQQPGHGRPTYTLKRNSTTSPSCIT